MLQKEVAVSEIWVIRMLRNWCAGVGAQYGPWSSLQITLWTPLFFPSLRLHFLFLPPMYLYPSYLLNPIKNIISGWEPLDSFSSFPLCRWVCCICLRLWSEACLSFLWTRMSVVFRGGVGTTHAPRACLFGFSRPLLRSCWLLFIFACSASWTSGSSIYLGPGLALSIHCLLATCCMEQVCFG